MGAQLFKIAKLCCVEKPAGYTQASIHLGTFLSLMKASVTEKCTKWSLLACLWLKQYKTGRAEAGWSGHGATTRELVLTMEKMLPRIPEQMSSSFCCLRWRWIWWRTTGSRMRRDSEGENTKVKKPFRGVRATSGSQWHTVGLPWSQSKRGWTWCQTWCLAGGLFLPLWGPKSPLPRHYKTSHSIILPSFFPSFLF